MFWFFSSQVSLSVRHSLCYLSGVTVSPAFPLCYLLRDSNLIHKNQSRKENDNFRSLSCSQPFYSLDPSLIFSSPLACMHGYNFWAVPYLSLSYKFVFILLRFSLFHLSNLATPLSPGTLSWLWGKWLYFFVPTSICAIVMWTCGTIS